MTRRTTVTSSTGPRPARTLLPFVVAALSVGVPLMTMSTVIDPDAPFLLATILFGLAAPALVLTHRQAGRAGVRALLRDCVRLPDPWWWLPLAALGLPVASWVAGTALGGAQPVTWGLVAFYAADLVTGALIINIWEEMAWTGFFQRRASSRWGVVGGGLVTALFFTAIHVPLAFGTADDARQVVTNLLLLAGVAVGVRLLVARIDVWSGGSLLAIGVLHSSFNATETVLEPAYDWVRIVVTIALGIGVVAFGNGYHPPTRLDGTTKAGGAWARQS